MLPTTETLPTAEMKVRVYFEDTDTSGAVYHANYLRFMERARTEMMRVLGVQLSETMAQHITFVVHSVQMRFARPARLDDLLTIMTRLTAVRAASLIFAQRIHLPVGDVACEAEITVACVNVRTQRAQRIPDELMGRVRRLLPLA